MKKVLFCGHRSFAAQGLQARLEEYGHEVLTFSRGPLVREGWQITGPVKDLAENPYLDESFDTVINYIQLHRQPVEDNEEYIRGLLRFCESRKVKHLIHISSCSAYKNKAKFVDENAPVETDPSKKGVYAAVKAAQENVIKRQRPQGLKVSIVRPGLILANGMGGFMGGIGIRLPWNSILGLGDGQSQLPLVTREAVNASVLELINNPPEEDVESILLADTHSPTRKQYIEYCREIMGAGIKIHFFPVPLWLTGAFCAEVLTRLIGKGRFGIYGKVSSVCRFQCFNASQSEKRLGVSFSADWKQELYRVFDDQEPNFDLPPADRELGSATPAKRINYVGFGRIVKMSHLPALKHIGFRGDLKAYDLNEWKDTTGTIVESIKKNRVESADLTVVCTPGPVHTDVIARLHHVNGPVLVEKPLCYSESELEQWLRFSQRREDPVMVCHNTRYKSNVLKMLAHLRKYNPGKLHHVSALFQSGPVNKDSAAWLRDERRSRTLLLDYALHRVDLMCMFGKGKPRLEHCRYELNQQGETSLIEGMARFENYTINFLFRQGLNQRKDRFVFTFQNYSVSLGFYPDIFVPQMADDNFGLSWLETWNALRGTILKARDKLFNTNSDHSHTHVIQAAIAKKKDHQLTVEKLVPVYDLLFQISHSVYGE
ncbi:MAG TPA: SDR family oxidoreductase [Thermodesulfobacteriota bacterium]|nr:SDR family oxidoreductase [Thermodesulfobacteriota bacterium]